MSRRTVRSEAMKYIYAKSINESFALSDFILNFSKIKNTNERESLELIINGISKIEDKLESLIRQCSNEYDKLNQLDLSIIKVGAFELIYTNLPKSIVINEAIEIAKEFGDDISRSIVNGILDCIGENNGR
ncbi:transcription antitermination factor NusB [Desulfurella sp.]|uniref:transcription antitermination factor NusB n=1 Tax=Desulfurella sp. TaxID=1962857 RepID=UPI003D0DE6AA